MTFLKSSFRAGCLFAHALFAKAVFTFCGTCSTTRTRALAANRRSALFLERSPEPANDDTPGAVVRCGFDLFVDVENKF